MDWRRSILVGACLFLCGFASCGQFLAAQQEADRRADAMQKECDALRHRAISFEEEQSFGGAVSVNWVSQGGGLIHGGDADALHRQLNKIGRNLAAQSSRPTLPWTFGVLQSQGVNAVSGPGGYVFVTEGLLARLDNEAQLAGVLAHEIAHITGKHAMREYQTYLVSECEKAVKEERSNPMKEAVVEKTTTTLRTAQERLGQNFQGLAKALPVPVLRTAFTELGSKVKVPNFDGLGTAFIQAVTQGVINQMAEKGFPEEDEFAADQDAVELMAAAGYDPKEYVTFLSRLPDSGLSTAHPSKKTRQKRLGTHLEKLGAPARDDDFTTSVDLSQTKVVPLRGELQLRRAGTAARTE